MTTPPNHHRDTIHTITLFSGGIGSFAAALRIADQHGPHNQTLLFTDTRTEDEDLYRFITEAAAAVGSPLVTIADGRDVWQVFRDNRFIGNTRADICSRVLKRDLARQWIDERYPDGVSVALGIDWTEIHRYERLLRRTRDDDPSAGAWPADEDCEPCRSYGLEPIDRPHDHHWWPHTPVAPMCLPPYLSPPDVRALVRQHGIQVPRLYDWSPHNNCGGFCVKGGHAQFRALLLNMPDRYAYHEAQEEAFRVDMNADVAILRDRTGGTTTPLTLREFRERIEAEDTGQLRLDDWGGCGCMIDTE